MKHLLTLMICLCLLAAITPAVSAALYGNYTAFGSTRENIVVPAVAKFPDVGRGYYSGAYHAEDICEQICIPETGKHFWKRAFQPSNAYRGWNESAAYIPDSWYSGPSNVSWNYTNADPEWNNNLTAVLVCSTDGVNVDYVAIYGYNILGTSPDVNVTANFNGTPTYGQAPLYVAFNDSSTGGIGTLTYNWSVSPDTGVIGEESTSQYPTMAFTQNGNYSITHCVNDTAGPSDCETKSSYISVYNSTSLVTTTFWAVDPLGHRVWDSAISLQDVGNSTWTNTSSPSGGVATITSLLGHVINGYATAAGYNDGETLGITADGVSGGIILMTPTNITNVSVGYVTLYVYAKESVGNAPISGAYINLAYEEGGSTRNDGSTTNTEGVASFVVPNNTLIYVYGEKVGYERVSTTKDSGSGSGGDAAVSVILYMTGQYVTPTVTATTGPGGTVPVTVDPRTPQEKESDIALILIDYGDMLVMFFIALTIIGGVKMIAK